jgi:hypothetical protein
LTLKAGFSRIQAYIMSVERAPQNIRENFVDIVSHARLSNFIKRLSLLSVAISSVEAGINRDPMPAMAAAVLFTFIAAASNIYQKIQIANS